jgi:TRAP transporter TAXI family solute receptor
MSECLRRRLRAGLRCVASAVLLSSLVLLSSFIIAAHAAPLEKRQLGRVGDIINQNTVSVISGNLNATYLTIAYDMSAVLDDGDNLRILPIVGKGGGQNLKDVRFLKGVDLGITQINLLNKAKRTGELGPLDDKFVYVAKLFNEEMHLVVRADSGITSIEQLRGKRVNFSDIGSGTQLSTRDIFEKLQLNAEEVNMGQGDAFEKLKTGDIAATILIAGKSARSIASLKASDGFRILPIPFSRPLQEDYLPAVLTNEDYPGLIAPGQSVETVAVGAVLIAYNWPKNTDRYRRIEKFVNAFFPRLAEFQRPPRHTKWRETNLAAVLPGWKRFEAAETWLAQNRETAPSATRGQFNQFLANRGLDRPNAPLPTDQREQLFREFLKWNENRGQR